MIAIILAVVLGVMSIVRLVFPESPFSQLVMSEAVQTGLGWLNWLLPINQIAVLFNAWAGAILVCVAALLIIKLAMHFGFKLAGV